MASGDFDGGSPGIDDKTGQQVQQEDGLDTTEMNTMALINQEQEQDG